MDNHVALTTKKINAAILHTKLLLVGNGDGYFYFIDSDSEMQIGDSVMVARLKHLTLDLWVSLAEDTRTNQE